MGKLKGYLYRKLISNSNPNLKEEQFIDLLRIKGIVEGKDNTIKLSLRKSDVQNLLTILDLFIEYAKNKYELDNDWFLLREKLEKALNDGNL